MITTYKRSKSIWDYYFPRAKYFLRKKNPSSQKHFLILVKMFFKKYKLKYNEKEIISIMQEHNMSINYSSIEHIVLIRKLTLYCLRCKLDYPKLYV